VSGPRRRARAAALLGTLAVLASAAGGVLHLLVWEPVAAVPGLSLAEVHEGLDRAGEPATATAAVVWAAVGVAIAAALLVTAWRSSTVRVPEVVIEFALVLVGAAPSFFVASFGYSLAVADTFGVSGGDHAGSASVLYAVSLAAAVVALGTAVGATVARRRAASAARASEGSTP